MNSVHVFEESLAFSHEQSGDPFWERIYRAAFPGFQGMVSVLDNGTAQQSGVDRTITTSSGRVIRVDEKVRKGNWNDFCLEYWSVYHGTKDDPRNRAGWMRKDLACDYIAYAFLPRQCAYLLPWPDLRRAWNANYRTWIENYPEIKAENVNYVTLSVGVPIDVVLDAIKNSSVIHVSEETT